MTSIKIRFHSYASRIGSKKPVPTVDTDKLKVSIHTLHELEARQDGTKPFVNITIQGFHSYASRIGSKSLLERVIVFEVVGFHSYASRIGSKTTLPKTPLGRRITRFPFIRFTNWKQGVGGSREISAPLVVSIHTLHELEARLYKLMVKNKYLELSVSIHTLHELEAR